MARRKFLNHVLQSWLFLWYINFRALLNVQANVRIQAEDLTAKMESIPYNEGYSALFGHNNIKVSGDGRTVQLILDNYTGSGFISQEFFLYGFFSASIKLAEDYTAGVVATFYTSNEDVFRKNHDELDFEFLGNLRRRRWRVQTNVYGNGSTSTGREERYKLWFDPTKDFHNYSILWNERHIVFFVDNVPIRELLKTDRMGDQYPSKPMSVYATMWDGSDWATKGGRHRVDYKYAPFVTTFTHLILEGCAVNPVEESPLCTADINSLSAEAGRSDFSVLSPQQKSAMEWFRSKHITYSYCQDERRYPDPLPECPPRKHGISNRVSSVDPGNLKGHGDKSRKLRPTENGHNPLRS